MPSGKAPAGAPALPAVGDWLAPFAALLIAGILGGIMIRVNEVLCLPAPVPSPNLRLKYLELGFTEEQVSQIMAEQAKALAEKEPINAPKPTPPRSIPSLLSAVEKAKVLDVLRNAEAEATDEEKLKVIEQNAPRPRGEGAPACVIR